MLQRQQKKDLFQLAIGRTVVVHVKGGARMYGCLSSKYDGFLIMNDVSIVGRKMLVDVEMLAVNEREVVHFGIAPVDAYLKGVCVTGLMLRERQHNPISIQDFYGKKVVVQSTKGEMYEGVLAGFYDDYALMSDATVKYPNGYDVIQVVDIKKDMIVHMNTLPIAKVSIEKFVREEKKKEEHIKNRRAKVKRLTETKNST